MIKSGGGSLSDQAARAAIDDSGFITTDFSDARLIFRFDYTVFSGKPKTDVELDLGGKQSAVVLLQKLFDSFQARSFVIISVTIAVILILSGIFAGLVKQTL